MDRTLTMPLTLYVVALLFCMTPGLVMLIYTGHWSSAWLTVVGMAYAIGLGRVLLWRRLGRPTVPPRRRRDNGQDVRPPAGP